MNGCKKRGVDAITYQIDENYTIFGQFWTDSTLESPDSMSAGIINVKFVKKGSEVPPFAFKASDFALRAATGHVGGQAGFGVQRCRWPRASSQIEEETPARQMSNVD